MIVSSVDGRLRIRDDALRNPSTARALEKRLLALKGIVEVKINQRIGSLLVLYDEAVTGIKGIRDAVAGYLDVRRPIRDTVVRKRGKERSVIRRISKKVSNIGMLASLAFSVIAAILGAEGLHVASGALFLFFFAMHFSRHRELVFA